MFKKAPKLRLRCACAYCHRLLAATKRGTPRKHYLIGGRVCPGTEQAGVTPIGVKVPHAILD